MDSSAHATALYDMRECTVLPLFDRERDRFTQMMRYAIALNGSFFTAQRMLQQYVVKAYGLDAVREPAPTPPSPQSA
jgi:starch phosphorylase